IFVAFSAEELGLLGSRHYADHPPVPLSTTKAMLNLDMVGRLKENRLTVFGTHSAKELSGIVTEEARRLGLEVRESDSVGRSQEGVRLAGVSDGSPAALAGLREGDVIVEFAGNKVQNLEDLANLLGSKKPGDEVEIMVLRTGKPVTLKAILRARS